MQKWQPRRPSNKVYERVFNREEPADLSWFVTAGDLRRWFVPALGSLALAFLTLQSPHGVIDPFSGSLPVGASSELVHAKFENFFTVHNALPSQTLEWSFGAPNTTSVPALFAFTNSLLTK